MRLTVRNALFVPAVLTTLAIAACEDGPKQTYVAPPPDAGGIWNDGRANGISPNGTATGATQSFGGGTNTGGNNANNICNLAQQSARWMAMVEDPILPPNRGAGVDLAGWPQVAVGAPSPLNTPWDPTAVENWQGLTIEQAEHINCQGTDLGTYFGGTDEFAIQWGNSGEVVLDSYVSNHKAFYLGLNSGYLGTMVFTSPDGNTKYTLSLNNVPIQVSVGGATATAINLDWVDAAGGDPTAMKPFDDLFRALMNTYGGGDPEAGTSVTCNQTNACQIIHFPGGNICSGQSGPGDVFFVAALNWDFWVQPDTTQLAAGTACRMDINLEQLMNYSNLSATLKLDDVGPTSNALTLGHGAAACQLELGMSYGDFLNDCVQTDGSTSGNASELAKLNAGLTHDQETFQFNVPGIDLSFSSGGSLGPTQVVLDSSTPSMTDPATEFNVDQNTLGLVSNDWTINSSGALLTLQGAGALYDQFRRLAITYIWQEAGLGTPNVDTLIANCLIPRDSSGNELFTEAQWLPAQQAAHCTGLEGLLTGLQRLDSSGNPDNDDPTDLGMIPTGGTSALVTALDPGYALGMKPGTQLAMFCDDSISANNLIGNNTAMMPFPPPASCVQGAILPTAYAQVIKVFGGGAISNLPLDVQDSRFMFKMMGLAMIQTMEATAADSTLKSQPSTWGTDGTGTAAPISFDDLYFDSAGSGQFTSMEYVDRRFVCPSGANDCCPSAAAMTAHSCCPNSEPNCNPNEVAQPPLDLTWNADVIDGIMGAYDIWQYAYRGETVLYDAMQEPGYAVGKKTNALASNVFGAPALVTAFPAYECAITTAANAASLPDQGAACNGTFNDSYGVPFNDIDNLPIDFTHYQGAWNPTPLSLSYPNIGASTISVTQTYPANPTGYEGTIATNAMIAVPQFDTPYFDELGVTTQTQVATIHEMVPYVPNIPGNGFPIALYGQSTVDQWIQTASLDFSGITTSVNVDYTLTAAPTRLDPNAVAVNMVATESPSFLGDVFMCFLPGATLNGQPMPFLAPRMFSPVNKMMEWLTENPQAYSNQAPGCGIVVRWTPYDNYVDSIESTTYGVRLDVTQGGGFGRVVGVETYVPGQNANL